MSKPTLFIDMDNVLFDTVDAIKYMYDEDFRLYSDYHEVFLNQLTSYDFSELNLLTKKQLTQYFNSGRFFDVVNCIDGAELSLCTLNGFNKIPIVFVSIGTPENLKGKKLWINQYNENYQTDIKFIGISDKDKSQVDMSGGILIDDLIQNLESSNADMKICFGDYGWNKDWDGIRVTNWSQLRKLVFEEVNKRAESEDQIKSGK